MNSENEHPTIVSASGEIDLSNVAPFVADLDNAVRESPKGFVVDLRDATYMDSAGVQAILNAYVKVRRTGGIIVIVTTNSVVISILQVISADRLPGLYICDSLESAEQILAGSEGRSVSNQ